MPGTTAFAAQQSWSLSALRGPCPDDAVRESEPSVGDAQGRETAEFVASEDGPTRVRLANGLAFKAHCPVTYESALPNRDTIGVLIGLEVV